MKECSLTLNTFILTVVERVHKTIDDEYYLNPYRVWKTPYEWLHYYNYERIHLTLDGLTPKEYYKKCVTLDC